MASISSRDGCGGLCEPASVREDMVAGGAVTSANKLADERRGKEGEGLYDSTCDFLAALDKAYAYIWFPRILGTRNIQTLHQTFARG